MQAADDFSAFVRDASADEPETAAIAARFSEMAEDVAFALTAEAPADLVRLLIARPHPDLCTATGSFRAYKKKGKWGEAAKRVGLSKADGDRLNAAAETHNAVCCEAWTTLLQAVAARVLADLVRLVQPVMDRFRDYKRSAALLDFDDLIFAARDLLRDHEAVRHALAARLRMSSSTSFKTPTRSRPKSSGVFVASRRPGWMTPTGRRSAFGRARCSWSATPNRRSIAFAALTSPLISKRARPSWPRPPTACCRSLPTSAPARRSCSYVNERFGTLLSVENGQPGFTPLDPFHPERDEGLCVAALDVAVADEDGKASAEQQRDGEAEAVADMCARLIGSEAILDRKTGERRPCRPGDIALLAPTGSDLWRYEEALERRGIPVCNPSRERSVSPSGDPRSHCNHARPGGPTGHARARRAATRTAWSA